ncbi:MAG: tRNA guanosine(34) transglycosylase Tgt, partial [Acidobacteria bacterium]|nr:tRNA guanosine(34) transglycosylase Tgt [Acidobacteriota bacterium]
MEAFRFTITHTDSQTKARTGLLETPHGSVETPVFLPVGTAGSVKGLSQETLEQLGIEMILANTYHLHLRPGEQLIRELGGLHRFMSWRRPILTDSGGFQVLSMSGLREIRDDGVRFRSHLDGSLHFLSPERALEMQRDLGSDVQMVLDECIEFPASQVVAQKAMERTLHWAERSLETWQRQPQCDEERPAGALFAIVQGGTYPALRSQCAALLVEMNFPGYAIGGLSVGEPRPLTYELLAAAERFLPPEKPRYAMGVGLPEELPH